VVRGIQKSFLIVDKKLKRRKEKMTEKKDTCGICNKKDVDHKNGTILWGVPVHNDCGFKNDNKDKEKGGWW
jgi:hypothetical protein